MKNILGAFLITILAVSCSAEKVSLSPVYSTLVNNSGTITEFRTKELDEKSDIYLHISEMTNILNAFPASTNKDIEKELSSLKFNLKEYVYATEAYNVVGRERALKNIEKSYKKIQQIRNKSTQQEDEVVNASLVRIKSHISKLELLQQAEK